MAANIDSEASSSTGSSVPQNQIQSCYCYLEVSWLSSPSLDTDPELPSFRHDYRGRWQSSGWPEGWIWTKRRHEMTKQIRIQTLKVESVRQTHSSIVTACSYALVAFSTSSRLVRATVNKEYEGFKLSNASKWLHSHSFCVQFVVCSIHYIQYIRTLHNS